MSNPSESELFNKFFINFQQVCYILKFKNNQELYICITSLANELKKKNSRSFAHFSRIFLWDVRLKFLQRERYLNVWLHYKQKYQFSQWKNPTISCVQNRTYQRFLVFKYRTYRILQNQTYRSFLTLQTEHTDNFFHLKPIIPNLAEPNITNLSYIPNRTYRISQNRTYRSFLSF